MKKYRVEKVEIHEDYYSDVLDLVNVKDPNDRYLCAEDEFVEGDVINDNEFTTEVCQYTDEHGFGSAPFAFKVK
jgi:hypothetical protein